MPVEQRGTVTVENATAIAGAPPLLLTIEEATDLLRVSRSKVYEYLRSGALRSVVIGRRRLVRSEDLRRFVEALPTVDAA